MKKLILDIDIDGSVNIAEYVDKDLLKHVQSISEEEFSKIVDKWLKYNQLSIVCKNDIVLCCDMLGAIEREIIILDNGEFVIKGEDIEIEFCPWCGRKLVNYEKRAMGDE